MSEPLVSIIIPARNEERQLGNCLRSIAGLDYPRDRIEVIVADGLSVDATPHIAAAHGAIVIENPKQTVSPGRNIAYAIARGDLIAFTDADCVVDRKWLINSLKYFTDAEVGCVGGPNLTPPDEGSFGRAVGFVFGRRLFSAGSVHARELPRVTEARSIPGCNALYRRDALEKVMPIDETLLTCDDTFLNRKILDIGYKLLYTPDVFVWHYRRSTPARLWRQMYRYAIGRLQAGKRDRRMINAVHVLTGLLLPFALILPVVSPLLFIILLLTGAGLLAMAGLYALIRTGSPAVAIRTPAVIFIIAAAWSAGFLRELLLPIKKAGKS
jgi:cellulose synthase/poly-beta-1,6-N-acetylglucosamine synthase-like glycosyltransferase